jgi:hypothetical protein
VAIKVTESYQYNYSYIKNSRGFNTPKYEIEVTLKEHVPEWLPMYGKKVRIFYHGMPRQCNGCYKLGHLKWECKEDKLNWRSYVFHLRSTGNYEDALFGSWLDEKPKEPENDGKTPRTPEDLRELMKKPGGLKKALIAYLAKDKKDKSNERSRERSPRASPARRHSRERSRDRDNRNNSRDRNGSNGSNRRGRDDRRWRGGRGQWQNRKRYQGGSNHSEEKREKRGKN